MFFFFSFIPSFVNFCVNLFSTKHVTVYRVLDLVAPDVMRLLFLINIKNYAYHSICVSIWVFTVCFQLQGNLNKKKIKKDKKLNNQRQKVVIINASLWVKYYSIQDMFNCLVSFGTFDLDSFQVQNDNDFDLRSRLQVKVKCFKNIVFVPQTFWYLVSKSHRIIDSKIQLLCT